jgi:hypothetical protein
MPTPEEDPPPPYDGPSQSGTIPVIDPSNLDLDAGQTLVDAGLVTVETRCCDTNFRIADQEPADAVGVIEGELGTLRAGVPLTRSAGQWTAAACVTINSSGAYWYRFTWDGGVVDAGLELQPDGGEEIVLVPVTESAVRASALEPTVSSADGLRNFYSAVNSCDGLDGGVPP